MRDYAKLCSEFFTGTTGRKLHGALEAQVLGTYLLASPQARMTGLYYCPTAFMAAETGMSHEQVLHGLRKLVAVNFCSYEGKWVFVHEMARFQVGIDLHENDNRIIAVKKAFEAAPASALKQKFYEKYGQAFYLPAGHYEASPVQEEAGSLLLDEQDLSCLPQGDASTMAGHMAAPATPSDTLACALQMLAARLGVPALSAALPFAAKTATAPLMEVAAVSEQGATEGGRQAPACPDHAPPAPFISQEQEQEQEQEQRTPVKPVGLVTSTKPLTSKKKANSKKSKSQVKAKSPLKSKSPVKPPLPVVSDSGDEARVEAKGYAGDKAVLKPEAGAGVSAELDPGLAASPGLIVRAKEHANNADVTLDTEAAFADAVAALAMASQESDAAEAGAVSAAVAAVAPGLPTVPGEVVEAVAPLVSTAPVESIVPTAPLESLAPTEAIDASASMKSSASVEPAASSAPAIPLAILRQALLAADVRIAGDEQRLHAIAASGATLELVQRACAQARRSKSHSRSVIWPSYVAAIITRLQKEGQGGKPAAQSAKVATAAATATAMAKGPAASDPIVLPASPVAASAAIRLGTTAHAAGGHYRSSHFDNSIAMAASMHSFAHINYHEGVANGRLL